MAVLANAEDTRSRRPCQVEEGDGMRYKVIRVVDHEATGADWRRHREQAGVSLRDLAQTMGVSAPYLSDLERGRRNWSDEIENKVASALRVQKELPRMRDLLGTQGIQGQQGMAYQGVRAYKGNDQGNEGGHQGHLN